jgi:V-type H+-transporting ATPase subunit A
MMGIIEVTGFIPIGEFVQIGPHQLPGEVVRQHPLMSHNNSLVYLLTRDMQNINIDDEVIVTNTTLCAPIGPAMLGHGFDSLMKPLTYSRRQLYYEPCLKIGDSIEYGTEYGSVPNVTDGKLIILQDITGTVSFVAEAGVYEVNDTILTVITDTEELSFSMRQRVSISKLEQRQKTQNEQKQVHTGIRIIDSLVPLQYGEIITIRGPSATGKTSICTTICNNAEFDAVVYVCYFTQGNMIKKLSQEPFAKKAVFITSTMDSSPHAQRFSEYTGNLVAQYLKALGLLVLLVFDDIVKGELTQDAPYSFVTSQVTTIHTVPEHADFTFWFTVSDPFLQLDKKLAQTRSYPAISTPLLTIRGGKPTHGKEILRLLSHVNDIEEIVQLIGLDCLEFEHILDYKFGKILRKYFFEQNFDHEPNSSFEKTIGMMRNLLLYYQQAKNLPKDFSFRTLEHYTFEIVQRLIHQREIECDGTEGVVLEQLYNDILGAFRIKHMWSDLDRIRKKVGGIKYCEHFGDVIVFVIGNSTIAFEKKLSELYDDYESSVLHRLALRLVGTDLEYLLDE